MRLGCQRRARHRQPSRRMLCKQWHREQRCQPRAWCTQCDAAQFGAGLEIAGNRTGLLCAIGKCCSLPSQQHSAFVPHPFPPCVAPHNAFSTHPKTQILLPRRGAQHAALRGQCPKPKTSLKATVPNHPPSLCAWVLAHSMPHCSQPWAQPHAGGRIRSSLRDPLRGDFLHCHRDDRPYGSQSGSNLFYFQTASPVAERK